MAEPAADPLLRAPLQERSRRTLERILAAGWKLLESTGPDALTVQSITKLARTSVGSFYARFPGKDDLLRYMGNATLADATAEWETLREGIAEGHSADSDLRTTLEGAVHGLGEFYLEGAGQRLALLDGIEDPEPSRRRQFEDRLTAELSPLIGGPRVRAELAVRILAGTLHDAAARQTRAAGEGGSPYPPSRVLVSELVELLSGYLGGEVRPPVAWVEDVSGAPLSEEVEAARDEAPPPSAPPAEPAEPPPPEPDPFAVWG